MPGKEVDTPRSALPTIYAVSAAVAVALCVLAIYARTMAPTITLRHNGADSGDLVTAAINLGVPHPTGYPLYTLIAHCFTRLPGIEPARGVNLLSALAAALSVAAVFWASYRLLVMHEDDGLLALVASGSAAGLYAFSELLWSQATIAEVYSLNALLVAVLLALMLSLPLPTRLYAVAFLFGLGLAHHLTIVWLIPALWPYAGVARAWLSRRRVFYLALCLLPGLLLYLYIPIRAAARPVPNWGGADNLSGFLWLVTGEAYRRYLGGVLPLHFLQRLSAWAGIWVRDLHVLGLALALLGLWRGLETDRRFTCFGLTYVVLLSVYAMLYITHDSYLYLLPAAGVIALWTARGAMLLLHDVQKQARAKRVPQLVLAVAILLLLALPVASVMARFREMDLSADRQAYNFAQGVLQMAAPGAIVISKSDTQTLPLWYVRYGLGMRPDVMVVDRYLLAFDWYRRDLAVQHPALAMVTKAHDSQEAVSLLVLETPPGQAVHLTYADNLLFTLASWVQEGSLFTLFRQ
nr:DUF2723 domain-containing protein [Chloroflexota bacterium]